MCKSVSALLAAAVLAACAPYAHADTIVTFNVSGTAANNTGGLLGTCTGGSVCSFSGTLGVDVTAGTITGVDLTFPGLSPFNAVSCCAEAGFLPTNNGEQSLALIYTTEPTPNSLVGFNGGTILGEGYVTTGPDYYDYTIKGGSITAPASTVTEAGSLILMLAGLGILTLFAKRKSRSTR